MTRVDIRAGVLVILAFVGVHVALERHLVLHGQGTTRLDVLWMNDVDGSLSLWEMEWEHASGHPRADARCHQ